MRKALFLLAMLLSLFSIAGAQTMTYTTTYQLRKPAQNSIGWADNINLNFDDIDSLLSGNRAITNLNVSNLGGAFTMPAD
jgi:hypothetical protein